MSVFALTVPEKTSRRREAPRRRPLSGAFKRILRVAGLAVGGTLMVAGAIIAPLPGPFGLPLAALGLVIVLRSSHGAKRTFVRLSRRHPRWVFPVRRLMRRRPEIAPVMWQQMLRMERLVGRGRVLGRLRRRLFGRRPARAARA